MPSVRIVSHAGEASRALTEELRSRGFEVYMVAPGQRPAVFTDVEIHLNDCPVQEALQRADAVAEIATQNAEAAAATAATIQETSTPSDWPIWQLEAQEEPAVEVSQVSEASGVLTSTALPVEAAVLAADVPVVTAAEAMSKAFRVRIPLNPIWFRRISYAVAGAALCGLLGVATVHRFSPFGNKVSASSPDPASQSAPFQKVDEPVADTLDPQPLQNAAATESSFDAYDQNDPAALWASAPFVRLPWRRKRGGPRHGHPIQRYSRASCLGRAKRVWHQVLHRPETLSPAVLRTPSLLVISSSHDASPRGATSAGSSVRGHRDVSGTVSHRQSLRWRAVVFLSHHGFFHQRT